MKQQVAVAVVEYIKWGLMLQGESIDVVSALCVCSVSEPGEADHGAAGSRQRRAPGQVAGGLRHGAQ